MRLLIRSWNVFHGRTHPPAGRTRLREAVRLAAADGPDALCLQELPVWALHRLAGWAAMRCLGDVVRRPPLGRGLVGDPVARYATVVAERHLRSGLAGQANALLLGDGLAVEEHASIALNDRAFRDAQAAGLGLDAAGCARWGREPRRCQAARIAAGDGGLVVANVHLTGARDHRLADAELRRAVAFAETLARPGDAIVVAGDLNLRAGTSDALAELAAAGFSPPGPGIDHVLVRGAAATPVRVWPEARRRHNGRVLSDHPPVELEVS